MTRIRPLLAALIATACLAAPAGAVQQPVSLGVRPFTLTADKNARKVNVGVTPDGTGHFAWDVSNQSGDDPFVYCRVPRGQRACQAQQTIALPLEAFGEPQVLIEGTAVVLITHRCCGTGEGTYAIVSTDGGTTFAAPKVIGDVEPGQAVLWPGTDVVALADDVVSGIHFQAASLSGPPATTAAQVGDASGQGYDGTIGFPATVPVVAFDDLHNAFWRRWSGSGDVNDVATWEPAQPLGKLAELRMGTGPKGVVLMGKRETPTGSVYVARRLDPATSTFGKALALSSVKVESDVIFRDVFEDAGGNVAAVWDANNTYGSHSDPLRYRVSTNGGKTFKRERTLVGHTDDAAFNLQLGAAPDGGGFVAWDRNDSGPLKAVPIPPIAKQGSGIPPKHKKHH